MVNGRGGSATVTFELGLDTHYGLSVVPAASPVTGTGDVAVSTSLTGLLPQTTYYYRVVATNDVGESRGADTTFVTPARYGIYLPAVRRR